MKNKTLDKTDNRPRFGWTDVLDDDPQVIYEKRILGTKIPVAVIPLPFMSAKQRHKVREFTKETLWPKT